MSARARSTRAFTLVELLMVVLVLGVLASIAIPTYSAQKASARDAAAQSAVRVAMDAANAWYFGHGESYEGIATAGATGPMRANLVTNPNPSSSLAGWGPTGGAGNQVALASGGGVQGTITAVNQAGVAYVGLDPAIPASRYVAGERYVFSAEVTLVSGDGSNLGLRYGDSTGTRVMRAILPPLGVGETRRAWVTATAGGVKPVLWVFRVGAASGGAVIRVRNIAFGPGSTPFAGNGDTFAWAWDGAPGASTSHGPLGRVNLAPAATGRRPATVAQWATLNSVASTPSSVSDPSAPDGGYFRVLGNGPSPQLRGLNDPGNTLAIPDGATSFSFGAWARSDAAGRVRCDLRFYGAAGAILATQSDYETSGGPDAWTRCAVLAAPVPAGAARMGAAVTALDALAGQYVDVAAPSIVEGDEAVGTLNGDLPGCEWSGAANASPSICWWPPASADPFDDTIVATGISVRADQAPGADAAQGALYVGRDNASETGDGTGEVSDRPSASRIVICSVSRGKRTYCARATSGRWEYAASTGPISSTTSYRTEGWS